MEMDFIMQALGCAFRRELFVKFVAEKGENCCEECSRFHGQIFSINDPNIPQLPLHPNCRCKFEVAPEAALEAVKSKIYSTAHELGTYAKKVSNKATNLSREAEKLIIQAQKGKDDFDFRMKVSSIIVAIQYTMFAQEKIQETKKFLKERAESLQVEIEAKFMEEPSYFESKLDEYLDDLIMAHYARLDEEDQQLENLPPTEEEAIKRGFKLASDKQNWYHRNKGQKENKKYYHPITGQEVVFGKDGKVVTIPENIGTKNYGPNPNSKDHIILDIVPYWIWGNSADDTTPLWKRIFGSH